MRKRNIRNAADRQDLLERGYAWVTAVPRGEHKGTVRSCHRFYGFAETAAKGKDRDIVEVATADSY